MNIISMLKGLIRPSARAAGADTDASWFIDPLSHPEIERMSERQLADLPLAPDECGCQPA